MKALMAPSQIQVIVDAVPEGGSLLEWGSGGTTLILLRMLREKGARLTTVEHHPEWYTRVAQTVDAHGLGDSWGAHLVDVRYEGTNATPGEETPAGANDYIWRPLGTRHDVYLVDGIARGACLAALRLRIDEAKWAAPAVFLHDTQRNWYEWAERVYTGGSKDYPYRDGEYPAELRRLYP